MAPSGPSDSSSTRGNLAGRGQGLTGQGQGSAGRGRGFGGLANNPAAIATPGTADAGTSQRLRSLRELLAAPLDFGAPIHYSSSPPPPGSTSPLEDSPPPKLTTPATENLQRQEAGSLKRPSEEDVLDESKRQKVTPVTPAAATIAEGQPQVAPYQTPVSAEAPGVDQQQNGPTPEGDGEDYFCMFVDDLQEDFACAGDDGDDFKFADGNDFEPIIDDDDFKFADGDDFEPVIDDDQAPKLFVSDDDAAENDSERAPTPEGELSVRGKDGKWKQVDTSEETRLKKLRDQRMGQKVAFTMLKAGLEDEAVKGNKFSQALIDVIGKYERADQGRPDVLIDPDMSDPSGLTLSLPEPLVDMRVLDWTCLQPLKANDSDSVRAWYTEATLANMVMVNAAHFAKGAHFLDPAVSDLWLNGSFFSTIDQHVAELQRDFERLPEGAGYPAADMPNDAKFLVLAYNPGNHWVAIKLEPDFETREGTIYLYDSLMGVWTKKRVEKILPAFAELVNARPELEWKQTSWKVVSGQSTKQANTHDCGPITAANCSALLQGQELHIADRVAAGRYGVHLRESALQPLYKVFLGNDCPVVPSARGSGKKTPPKPESPGKKKPGPLDDKKPASHGKKKKETAGDGDEQPLGTKERPPLLRRSRRHQTVTDYGEEADDDEDEQPTVHQEKWMTMEPPGRKNKKVADDNDELASSEKKTASKKRASADMEEEYVDEVEEDIDEDIDDVDDDTGVAVSPARLRFLLCDLLYEAKDPWTLDDVISEMMDSLPALQDDERLVERVRILLEETTSMFEWDWLNGVRRWYVRRGAGRSVHDAARRLCEGPWSQNGSPDFTPDLIVTTVRLSVGNFTDAKFKYARGRMDELFEAYWSRFGHGEQTPDALELGEDESFAALTSDDFSTRRMQWFRTQEGSREIPFLLRTRRSGDKDGEKVIAALDAMNNYGMKSGRARRVLILANGADGITTNNDAWQALKTRWRYVEVCLCLAVKRHGINVNAPFLHYRLSELAKFTGSEIDLEDATKSHYQRFLTVCQGYNCWKLDCSLGKMHKGVNITHRHTDWASLLVTIRRNMIDLEDYDAEIDDVEDEVDDVGNEDDDSEDCIAVRHEKRAGIPQVRWTKAESDAVATLYAQGTMNFAAIAAQFGRTSHAVRCHLQKRAKSAHDPKEDTAAALPRHELRRWTGAEKRKLLDYTIQGYTYEQISRVTKGRTVSSIKTMCSRLRKEARKDKGKGM